MFSYIFTSIHTLYGRVCGTVFWEHHCTSNILGLCPAKNWSWRFSALGRWVWVWIPLGPWHPHFSSWDISNPARVGVRGHAETNHCTTCGRALAIIGRLWFTCAWGCFAVLASHLSVRRQLFWEKKLSGLNAFDIAEELVKTMDLPKGLQGKPRPQDG